MKQHIAVGSGGIGMRMNNITISEFNRISHLIQNAKHSLTHTHTLTRSHKIYTEYVDNDKITIVFNDTNQVIRMSMKCIYFKCNISSIHILGRLLSINIVLQIHRIMFFYIPSFELQIHTNDWKTYHAIVSNLVNAVVSVVNNIQPFTNIFILICCCLCYFRFILQLQA